MTFIPPLFNNFCLIFMCLSPPSPFQFLSLCSVPPACWKDMLRFVCVTLMAYLVFITYWTRSGHRIIFSTLPWFPWKVCDVNWMGTTALSEFSLQCRISCSSSVCDQLTNRISTEQSVPPSKKNISFGSFLFIHFLQLMLSSFRPFSCDTNWHLIFILK